MIFIKTNYICLLYLESLDIPDKDKLSFFYNVCKCTNISDSKMIPLSSIYALYGVFGGKPVTQEQLDSVNKRHVAKRLECASLIKRKAFKDLDIEMNACCLCPYSKSYRNARKKHEDIVLRKLVEPTIPFKHSFMLPEKSFYSVNRIATDYAIGKYPIVQLNYHLYNCLFESSNKRLSKEELIKDFSNYLINQDDEINSFYLDKQDELEKYVSIYINDLFSIKLDDLKNGVYEESVSIVSDVNYKYTPHITNIATKATDISNTNYEEKKQPLADESLNKNSINQEDKYLKAVKAQNYNPSADEINECISEANIKAIAEDMQHNTYDKQIRVNDETSEFCYTDGFVCRHCLPCKTDVSNNVYNTHMDCIPYKCALSNKYYTIQGDFINEVIFFNKETSHQFITDMVRSYYISIECAIVNNRKGFLLYSSYNRHFYFYDIEIEGIDPLIFQFNDPEKIIVSFHTLEVYALMHKYGRCNVKIHDLHALYCIQNSIKVYPLSSIIQDTIGHINKKKLDFYQFAMPIYRDLFPALYNSLMENKDILLEYDRTLRLYSVLSSSYNMSDLFSNSDGSIEQYGIRHFKYTFDWSYAFRNPGVLYRISLPNLIVSTQGIEANSFAMDVCLLFINIPHMHKQRSHIISVTDDEIIVYYEGNVDDSRKFYDILMRGIRKSYARHFSGELNTATYCVTYSN